jgi:predicted O-methyltransferase YrrM
MDRSDWERADAYLVSRTQGPDPVLDAAMAAAAAAGLPAIEVSPAHGKFLHLVARMAAARRILEIGTLGGYSTIWLARALPPGGLVVTLEANPRHAEVARANIARAGLAEAVEVRVGAALDTLPGLAAEAPFDLVFIDADKESNPDYLAWAMRLSRPGTVVICDNVVRYGAAGDPASPSTKGTRRFFDMIAAEPRLSATAIQTVGVKGWDGFAIAMVD